ncbi:MAG: MFS transporter [Acidobacteriota bacterium]
MRKTASPRRDPTLGVLHSGFALTGVFQAIGGALLPSLAAAFHLNDSQSGALFLFYFAGTSVGALLCVGRYARMMAVGFLLAALACAGIAAAGAAALQPLFLFLGIGVGVPMSAVSMFAGARYGERSAAPLTLLNFTWSSGALIGPLLAARLLVSHSYRAAYLLLGGCALLLAVACFALLQEPPLISLKPRARLDRVGWIALFAFLTFLEVGIENTTATWLATFSLRTAAHGAAAAAAASSLYWVGFLASRGFSSLLLLRAHPLHVLRTAVVVALASAALLVGLSGAHARDAAMLVLGAALGPVFPLLLARFFARAPSAADSRWVLAVCGFGGSVLPWATGALSTHAHSLRLGLAVVPCALLLMACTMPALGGRARAAE